MGTMIGPHMAHAPCDLSLQRRISEARRAGLIPRRRRRRSAQAPSADMARVALTGSEDVWHSLRG
jgi:hypothetical protein